MVYRGACWPLKLHLDLDVEIQDSELKAQGARLQGPLEFSTWTDSRNSMASGVRGVPLIRRTGLLKSTSEPFFIGVDEPCNDF